MDHGFDETSYSPTQLKLVLLYNVLREALMYKKYYAHRMTRLKRWNLAGDILIAFSASTSLTTATVFKSYVGDNVLTFILLFSAIATIVKPLLKLNRQILRLSKLQSAYLDLYQKLNRLRHDIHHAGTILPKHESRLTKLHNIFDRLGLRNEPRESRKRLLKIQDEVEVQIPIASLWLPQE